MTTRSILGFVLILLGATSSLWKELMKDEDKERFKKLLAWSGFCVSLLGLTLAIYTSVEDNNAVTASNRINDSLRTRELNLVGGSTVPPFFMFVEINPTRFKFILRDTSIYPVRDISISVIDEVARTAYKENLKKTIKDSSVMETTLTEALLEGVPDFSQSFSIPYLTFDMQRTIYSVDIGLDRKTFNFRVDINWTSGSVTYYIIGKRSTSGWTEEVKRFNRLTQITTTE